ncbi:MULTISPECIES: DUF2142 domain-containing protein [unclassified Arthrobacter]|nr:MULTISPECIES: DUF2142 domain-containing protein [unclassified Arthrobacter]
MHLQRSGRRPEVPLARTKYIPALVTFLILGTLSTLWSLASPLMSIPDEPAHTIKAAAVARGQLQTQESGKQGDPAIVKVPGYVAELGNQLCYAFKVQVSAACSPDINGQNTALVPATTTAGNYNPLYYLIVGLPSRLLSGETAVYVMRIASGLLSAVFMTMAIMAARQMRHGQWPLVAAVVGLTPMALYLAGSINPNSLEVVTTAAFFVNLCLALENSKSLAATRAPLIAVGVSGAVLANTRALSLLWLAIAFAVALIAYGWRPLAEILRSKFGVAMAGIAVLGCAAGLGWLVVADSFKSLGGIPSKVTPDQAFVTMLDRTFDYVSGYIGLMGWVDTLTPSGVQVFWHFAFVALVLAAVTSRPLRNRWLLVPVFIGVLVLPPILQSQVIQELGYIWQGRYLLALVVLMMLACGMALRFHSFPLSDRAKSIGRWTLVAAVAAHVYAFVFTLRRYTVGLFPEHVNWSEMWETTWQPPLTWQGLSIAYLITLTAGAVLLYRALFPKRHWRSRTFGAEARPMPQGSLPQPRASRLNAAAPAQAKVDGNRNGSVKVADEGDRRNAL